MRRIGDFTGADLPTQSGEFAKLGSAAERANVRITDNTRRLFDTAAQERKRQRDLFNEAFKQVGEQQGQAHFTHQSAQHEMVQAAQDFIVNFDGTSFDSPEFVQGLTKHMTKLKNFNTKSEQVQSLLPQVAELIKSDPMILDVAYKDVMDLVYSPDAMTDSNNIQQKIEDVIWSKTNHADLIKNEIDNLGVGTFEVDETDKFGAQVKKKFQLNQLTDEEGNISFDNIDQLNSVLDAMDPRVERRFNELVSDIYQPDGTKTLNQLKLEIAESDFNRYNTSLISTKNKEAQALDLAKIGTEKAKQKKLSGTPVTPENLDDRFTKFAGGLMKGDLSAASDLTKKPIKSFKKKDALDELNVRLKEADGDKKLEAKIESSINKINRDFPDEGSRIILWDDNVFKPNLNEIGQLFKVIVRNGGNKNIVKAMDALTGSNQEIGINKLDVAKMFLSEAEPNFDPSGGGNTATQRLLKLSDEDAAKLAESNFPTGAGGDTSKEKKDPATIAQELIEKYSN